MTTQATLPAWANWSLTVRDLRFPTTPPDTELHADLLAVRRALQGGQVQADCATIRQLVTLPPPKVGEANLAVLGDVELTLTRLRE